MGLRKEMVLVSPMDKPRVQWEHQKGEMRGGRMEYPKATQRGDVSKATQKAY